ncbi:MAG: tetratricopeptide repeat protein, partial [Proteobacteria bacterium]|nr:tetratricopeptide repeat protein [Pseudomonadota bacterium]
MKKIFVLSILLILLVCTADSGCYAADVCSIHIASYKNHGKAVANVASLKAKGYPAFYKKVDISGKGRWYRVYVGKYKSGAEALRVGKKLKRDGVIDYFKIQIVSAKAADEAREIHTQPLPLDEKKVAAEGEKKVVPADEKEVAAEDEKKLLPAVGEKKAVSVDKKKITAARVVIPRVKPVSPVVRRKLKEAKSSVEDNLYSSAMDDFKSGEYKEALGKFKEILQQGPLRTGRKEKVLRRLADCHYFLAEKGDSRDYLRAVDHYKKIIRDYPSSKENVTALYRLAGSYMNLKFYYESIDVLETLCSKYPESSYVPESIFEMGRMLYKIGKFREAIEKFKEYIKKFPDGKHIRMAFFRIGDCYSQMQQFDEAEIWYRDAVKRWPDLGDVPKDSLLKLGFDYFRSGRHQGAVEALFVHMNLYPDDEENRKVIYTIVNSFVAMNQFPAALMMSSQLIERYPESQEAVESEIIMANIGVKEPGIRAPLFMKGVQNYLNPLKTYDDMLTRFPFGEMNEGLLYQKGYALWKESRYKKSFDIYAHLLKQFPYGKYEKMSKKNLASIAEILVDKHYSKGDYLAVSDIYF